MRSGLNTPVPRDRRAPCNPALSGRSTASWTWSVALAAALVAIALLAGIVGAGEATNVVKVVTVGMMCPCGGKMVPTGVCLTSNPPQFPHVCAKCGATTNVSYKVFYPEIRYVSE